MRKVKNLFFNKKVFNSFVISKRNNNNIGSNSSNNISKTYNVVSLSSKTKFIAVILSFLLLLTTLSPLLIGKAYAQNYPVLSGITYLNMPEKTFGGKTTQCKLTITNFNLSRDKFYMSGILSYSSMNYPINIEGTLYRSRIGKDNFVALAKDKTNNFNILHFSILFNPDIHFLVTKKMKNLVSKETPFKSQSLPIITVYLQRKNTREVSFVEGKFDSIAKSFNNNASLKISILNIKNDLQYGIAPLDYFSFEIFVPLKKKTKLVEADSSIRQSRTPNVTDSPYETTYIFTSPNGDGYTMYGIYYKARWFGY